MASSWIVEFQTDAYKEFRQLDNSLRVQAIQVVRDLAEEPFPEDSIALRGHHGLYRIRCCGDAYRILYRVSEQQGKVIIFRVRPRASAYHGL